MAKTPNLKFDIELANLPEPQPYGDPTKYGLPDTVDYQALITMLEALLPGFDPKRVSWLHIDHRAVDVEVWTGSTTEVLHLPIRHVQGSATEGGQGT